MSKSPFFKFFISITAFAALIVLALIGTGSLLSFPYPTKGVWVTLVFFYVLTIIVYSMASFGLKKQGKTFIMVLMASMASRLIFSLLYFFIYLIINPGKDMPFVFSFLILYLLFTVFEIYFLVINLRPDSKTQQSPDDTHK